MDVVCSVCIVTCGTVGARVWELGVFHAYDVSCVHLWQFSILHDLQFVNAGRRCKMRPYERGILQSQFHDCLIGSQECPSVYPILLL